MECGDSRPGCPSSEARSGTPLTPLSDTYSKMSDMASQRITVRIPAPLRARLEQQSRADGQSPSDVVRVALEKYLRAQPKPRTAYDAAKAAGVIGCERGGPKDLSTNPKYFEGFRTRK